MGGGAPNPPLWPAEANANTRHSGHRTQAICIRIVNMPIRGPGAMIISAACCARRSMSTRLGDLRSGYHIAMNELSPPGVAGYGCSVAIPIGHLIPPVKSTFSISMVVTAQVSATSAKPI